MIFFNSYWIFGNSIYGRAVNCPPFKLSEKAKVVVFAPCRTGSTYVYNVLNYLFEDQEADFSRVNEKRVARFHSGFIPDKSFRNTVFITLRDPLQVTRSYCNLLDICQIYRAKEIAREVRAMYSEVFKFYSTDHLCQKVILDFSDLDSLLTHVERAFELQIDESLKYELSKLFNKKRMKEISDNLKSWRHFDLELALVGGHVNKQRSLFIQSQRFEKAVTPILEEAHQIYREMTLNL